MVLDGLTLRVAGLVATPFCVTLSDHVTFHGPVPVKAAEIVLEPPAHTVPPPDTVAVGLGFTVAFVVPAGDVQLFTLTVTEYVPVAAVVALVIDGFWAELLNELGPVHAYVAPVTVGVERFKVLPAQIGPLLEAVGVDGIAFTVALVVPVDDVQPPTVTLTE